MNNKRARDANDTSENKEADGFLKQYAETNRFRCGAPKTFTFTASGTVLFLRSGGRDFNQNMYEFDPKTGQEKVLLTAEKILQGGTEELSVEEKARRERMRISSKGVLSYQVSHQGSILVPMSGKLYLVDHKTTASREISPSEQGAMDPSFSPNGQFIAYIRDSDLYVTDLLAGDGAGVEHRLTKRTGDDITNGVAEFVAQEEMDRFRGYWWSPDSRYIAFQYTDNSPLETFYIMDPGKPEKAPTSFRYPRAGKANAVVKLGVIALADLTTGAAARLPTPVWVKWDAERYNYLAIVKWQHPGPLSIVVQNRVQSEMVLLSVDHKTGDATPILTERDDKWLNLDQSVPMWIAPSQFLWSSESSGVFQLSVYNTQGQCVRAVTPASLIYRQIAFMDARFCYVVAGNEPTEQHLHRFELFPGGAAAAASASTSPASPAPPAPASPVSAAASAVKPTAISTVSSSTSASASAAGVSSPTAGAAAGLKKIKLSSPSPVDANAMQDVEGGGSDGELLAYEPSELKHHQLHDKSQMTKGAGVHILTFKGDATAVVHEYQTLDNPAEFRVEVIDADSGTLKALGTLKTLIEEPPFPVKVSLASVHALKFRTAMLKPPAFDPAKKYPVILSVYGGPHHRSVVASRNAYVLQQWMANQGYVVVLIDGRGTPHRGRAWERALRGSYATIPVRDQVDGLLALGAAHSFLDLKRVCVYGWSYGGYMSAMLTMQRPDIFVAGVAGAPVVEWEDYDTHYTERYIGLPSEHAEHYKQSNVLTYADKLERPLLIVHGTADDNVYFLHSLKLSDRLFRLRIPHEFVPLSGHTHMVTEPVIVSSLYSQTFAFFEKHVKRV